MDIIVFDMDGVLVDSSHRCRQNFDGSFDLAFWRDNQHKAYQDTLLPMAAWYKYLLAENNSVVAIATARLLDKYSDKYIQNVLGEPDHIFGRNLANDKRSGGKIKETAIRSLLARYGKDVDSVIYFEDNKQYLKHVSTAYPFVKGYYIPSNQGY